MRLSMGLVFAILVLCVTFSRVAESKSPCRVCRRPVPVPQDLIEAPIDVLSEQREIVAGCSADLGRCPAGSCILTTRRFCPIYGVVTPVLSTEMFDCGPVIGSRSVERVVGCTCGEDPGIVLNIVVTDSATNAMLTGISVAVDGSGLTEDAGQFTTTIPSQSTSVVVSAVDGSGNYIASVKVVQVPLGFQGPIEVDVPLVKVADPIPLDISSEKQVSISSDPLNATAGVATLTLGPNSLQYPNGSFFSGTVDLSMNFLDVSDPDVEGQLPGLFLARDSGTPTPLFSDGIFALTFRDGSGNLLDITSVTIGVRPGMKLWRLGDDGLWEEIQGSNRKKRQTSLDQFTGSLASAQWVNIDKFPTAPVCYFKTRVFQSDGTTEIVTSTTTTFRSQVLAFRTDVTPFQRLRLYTPFTRDPATTCFPIRCSDIPNNITLVGFINTTSYETVIVGGVAIPVIQHLTPKAKAIYSNFQAALTAVAYEKADNNVDIFANFLSSAGGPFYTNLSVCEDSVLTEPAFHFIKPPLPSYEPAPNDTELCTARLGFIFALDEDLIANLSLPTVTALSVWTEGAVDFFYDDEAVIDVSTRPANATYISVCVTYRCSTAASPTTVYLSINSPNITLPANNGTGSNGTSALVCNGGCTAGRCSVGGFNGQFLPPADATNGPDYYAGTDSNCTQETNQSTFALTLFCFISQGGFPGNPSEDPQPT